MTRPREPGVPERLRLPPAMALLGCVACCCLLPTSSSEEQHASRYRDALGAVPADELAALALVAGADAQAVDTAMQRQSAEASGERLVELLLAAEPADEFGAGAAGSRHQAAELTAESFRALEAGRRPFVVAGGIGHWAAMGWTTESLTDRFGAAVLPFNMTQVRHTF